MIDLRQRKGVLMKRILSLVFVLACAHALSAAEFTLDRSVMSPAYEAVWNADVQKRIDADIEKYRKADAVVSIEAPAGTEVKVEQISHQFFFGAHIFNYNQLGKPEWNEVYKQLYNGVDIFDKDAVFNSATVAFYWRTLEPYPFGNRFEQRYEETEEYWCKAYQESPSEMMKKPHWRRPAPDPIISFLKTVGCRIHGHPIVWGNPEWHTPSWIWDDFTPESEKLALEEASGVKVPRWNWRKPMGCKDFEREGGQSPTSWYTAWKKIFAKLDEKTVASLVPSYVKALNDFTARRIELLAERYGTRVDSWDVVNESATDWGKGAKHQWPEGETSAVNKMPITASVYGPMPANYAFDALTAARRLMKKDALLNINEWNMAEFPGQIADLAAHGANFDVVGVQMHLFNPAESRRIQEGEIDYKVHPQKIRDFFANITKAGGGRPIHLSEITITAPGRSATDEMVQAVIMHDAYRAWFAVEKMNGITWWNVLDDCGAPGEPSMSGLFTRDMKPKAVYFAMKDLIQREWRTTLSTEVQNGQVAFRGFKGRYRLTWKGADGAETSRIVEVK